MADYKLYIEDLAGTWRIADLGNEKPAMNYQVNNLAELKDRQADYSQSLKLPITPTNCEIFGYSNEFDVVSEVPYRKLNCRLFYGDSVIAGKGSYLILERVTNKFETQILSGIADLFDTLKNLDMSSLDLGTVKLIDDNLLPENFSQYHLFGLATWISGSKSQYVTKGSGQALPFVYFYKAIEKMLSDIGYTTQTNVIDDLNKVILPCVVPPMPIDNFDAYYANALNNGQAAGGGTRTFYFTISESGESTLKAGDINFSPISGNTGVSLIYSNPFNCKVTMTFSTNSNPNNYPLTLIVQRNNNQPVEYSGITPIHSETFELESGETIKLKLEGRDWAMAYDPATISADVDFELIAGNKYYPYAGSEVNLASSLGFKTQLDFFKAFVQAFGMTILVDSTNKIVYSYTMQKVYDSKNIAKDWSGKLQKSKDKQMTFSMSGYAKKNIIAFNDNEKDFITDNSGVITITNESLENEKILFTLPFEAGIDNLLQMVVYNPIANIPIIAIEEESDKITFKETKPHLCFINESYYYELVGNKNRQYSRISHINGAYLIDNFYNSLAAMLTMTKNIEPEFNLDEQDIEEYKAVINGVPGAFIPVYVQKFGAYFYINKIKNFVSGKLTKCELVKL
jgi:hypothetical protein